MKKLHRQILLIFTISIVALPARSEIYTAVFHSAAATVAVSSTKSNVINIVYGPSYASCARINTPGNVYPFCSSYNTNITEGWLRLSVQAEDSGLKFTNVVISDHQNWVIFDMNQYKTFANLHAYTAKADLTLCSVWNATVCETSVNDIINLSVVG
ncbi:hypothetical protein F7396_20075 [Salmonella enterica]|nr:hypothetical protein [Salmonella enterica subsp. enterica serovar Sandiego]ECF1356153.1 hypothetical protein [Salmonella enterica subsp. enterica serovar Sandiego]ECZ0995767.1 hypothetical protein [Salmonella enterica]EHJ0329314.1 hypothetical protein [Salmonella enterica]